MPAMDVRLPEREEWSIPDLARLCRRDPKTIRSCLVVDPADDHRGTLHLPGGVTVRAHRDHQSNRWRIYRRHWELAVEHAAQEAVS